MTYAIPILAFANSVGLNVFFSKSVLAVARHDRLAAAFWNAAICGCSLGAAYIVFQHDICGIVAALAGAFVGTYLSVRPAARPSESAGWRSRCWIGFWHRAA